MPRVLAVIIARAGSKGLPRKCMLPIAGRPVIDYTFDHALTAATLDAVCLSTDCDEAKNLATQRGIFVIDRPAELASDRATVDAAVRHAVQAYETTHPDFCADVIVLLYGNIPLRPDGAIDRAVRHLIESGADSVRTVAPATKQHPDWLHRLDGDRLSKFRENNIYRRQDLEPLYYHDGAVVCVTRAALHTPPAHAEDFHAFFGRDRRAIIVSADATVDIDDAGDLRLAEAVLAAREPGSVRIGNATIGRGQRTFVIAEAGVNHDGDVSAAKSLIDAAVAAGADAVKFQAFSADRLVTRTAAACTYQQQHDPHAQTQHEMLRRLELAEGQFAALQQHAARAGILFMATPFSIDDLKMLLGLGVPAIKLASSDLVNVPLLRAAAASGPPMIVSTGAAEWHEIDNAVALIRRSGAGDRLVLLHCVSAYPTPPSRANLRAIEALARRYLVPAGYSDHTAETHTGALAIAAGATVLEKHLTLDRRRPGPDHSFSLEPGAFAEYVRAVREAETMLGDGRITVSDVQVEIRKLARGCVVAARTIRAGEKLSSENLAVKRAGRGLPPTALDGLLGRVALVNITSDSAVMPDMIGPRESLVPMGGPCSTDR